MATVLLTLSIINSAFLRRFLSHRYLVFFGSISFPMYLLHGPLLRSLLVWMLYGLIPHESAHQHAKMNAEGEIVPVMEKSESAYIWMIVRPVIFMIWIGILILLSLLWKNRIDSMNSRLTKTMEEIMTGKRPLFQRKETTVVKDLPELENLDNGDREKGPNLN